MASVPNDDASSTATAVRFADLRLAAPVLEALTRIGYESPSPIQARTIPPLLEGRDVLGQAQTGTGKTAAFALPILSMIDTARSVTQALVLAPTRELAIQVAEALQNYASAIPGFHVLPIYGGQSYEPQLRGLKRGAHVVVGTPGRVVDHIKRGSLKLDNLRQLVLDEADEMLRMGFIDDVEWVLQQTPPERQVALFSATMPSVIRRVAQTYLRDPVEISIKSKTSTATNIRQRYWLVSGMNKLEALTRFLEAETFDAMIVFARTKAATTELADRLLARGFSASALNGDMQQNDRERTIAKLKDGQIDIVVATDVAARGLDVERISHVVNYDIPTDTESYVHRIGRTGRAGRSGDAILFVSPRERHLLKAIERATRQPIEAIAAPSSDTINQRRVQRFKQTVIEALNKAQGDRSAASQFEAFRSVIADIETETGSPLVDIAAALASLAQGDRPLLMATDEAQMPDAPRSEIRTSSPRPPQRFERSERPERSNDRSSERPERRERPTRVEPLPTAAPVPSSFPMSSRLRDKPDRVEPRAEARAEPPRSEIRPGRPPERAERPIDRPLRLERPERPKKKSDDETETFRIEVGEQHGVKPANIVGAIANEAGLDSQYIGKIEINDDHSLVDLPSGMPRGVFRDLQKAWVLGRQLRISKLGDPIPPATPGPGPGGKRKPPRV
ncbi:DEAD/DEAH box helicase [Hydrocarboniphaga sp.]|uniref:DEAD/DEAH box helicase n=1 Tax=Hydrocarboniphaga sp. TaxID=2033016 RepID=UPI003D0FFB72